RRGLGVGVPADEPQRRPLPLAGGPGDGLLGHRPHRPGFVVGPLAVPGRALALPAPEGPESRFGLRPVPFAPPGAAPAGTVLAGGVGRRPPPPIIGRAPARAGPTRSGAGRPRRPRPARAGATRSGTARPRPARPPFASGPRRGSGQATIRAPLGVARLAPAVAHWVSSSASEPAYVVRTRESPAEAGLSQVNPGGELLSQGAPPQVPSAQVGLTAVFEMGTGVSPPP